MFWSSFISVIVFAVFSYLQMVRAVSSPSRLFIMSMHSIARLLLMLRKIKAPKWSFMSQ
jgi:hypothetical protein